MHTILLCQLTEPNPQNKPALSILDSYKTTQFRWTNKTKITYFFKDTPERKTNGMPLSDVMGELKRATDRWQLRSKLRFIVVDTEEEADIVVQFSAKSPHVPDNGVWPVQVIAYNFYPYSITERIAGDMFLNPSYIFRSWFFTKQRAEDFKSGSTDFYSVALHELGHALGIPHSDDSDAVMAPYYKRLQHPYELTADDIAAIQYAYGRNTTWSQRLVDRILANRMKRK